MEKKGERIFMANPHDLAYDLARAIKDSNEYRSMLHLQKELNGDGQARGMLDDFRAKQMALQMKQMQGEQIKESEMEQVTKLHEAMSLHPKLRMLLEAEQRFSLLLGDINRIMMEPLESLYSIGK